VFCFYFFLIGCQPNTAKSTNEAEATESSVTTEDETSIDEDASELDYKSLASAFITLVEKKDIKAIAAKKSYPLARQYPLPSITSSSEFIG
jgi:hypothetical protein